MKRYLYWLTAMAVGLGACTNDTLQPEETQTPEIPDQEAAVSNLKTAALASVASSQSRVYVLPETKSEELPERLSLIAEIENPSNEISGFVKEENGRYLSATCVYYDAESGKYYVTYHMQGNNYNTQQTNETGGLIESFTIEDNKPVLDKIYAAADPSKISFDFNHLLFDKLVSDGSENFIYIGDYTADSEISPRLIAVGHSSEPSSKEDGKPNTKAIIGLIDLENKKIDYKTVLTGEKLLDEEGKSLGDIDAQDVNCVVRKYNHYYLATRKGIAILKAAKDEIFEPELDVDDNIYFLKTPGSAKYISLKTFSSGVDFFFLTEDTPTDMTADTAIPGRIMNCAINNIWGDEKIQKDLPVGMGSVTDFNWESGTVWPQLSDPIESVSPVDGKNVMFSGSYNTGAKYACLGKNGLYINNPSNGYANPENHIMKFSDTAEGSRPVNCVVVEDYEDANGHHYTDGFIYVANGACLTILDSYTLEKVAEFSAFDGSRKASANFIHVVKTNDHPECPYVPSRIITVAYGQEGVKVFKFNPPVK